MKLQNILSRLLISGLVCQSVESRPIKPLDLAIRLNQRKKSGLGQDPTCQVRIQFAPFSLVKINDVFFLPQDSALYNVPIKPNKKPVSEKGYLARAYDGCKEFYKNLLYYLYIRRDLRSVTERQKNIYAKELAARRDSYNAKAALN